MKKLFAWVVLAAMLLSLVPIPSVQAAEETMLFENMLARAEEIVNYTWIPKQDMHVWNDNPYNGSMYFKAGEPVVGMPYTLFSWELGVDSLLSLAQFQRVEDINYSTYTYCNAMGAYREGPVYGSCCATFISEVYGGSFMRGENPRFDGIGGLEDERYTDIIENATVDKLRLGDALCTENGGHVVFIGAITDSTITIYEQTPPVARKVVLSKSSVDKYGYLIHAEHRYTYLLRNKELKHSSGNARHIPVEDPAVLPTETESGLTAGSHCGVCGEILTMQETIQPREHTPVTIPGVEPTCVRPGLTEGSYCRDCGQTLVEQEVIPALGHTCKEVTAHVDPEEYLDGYEDRICARCGAKYREILPITSCAGVKFTDVAYGAWYHEATDYMTYYGYVNGVNATNFMPNQTMTRAQLITILYRISGDSVSEEVELPFEDVPSNRYYSDAVAWAYENEVISGITETKFGPDEPATREQTVTILYRYAGQPPLSSDSLADFSDAEQVGNFARNAMVWAVANDVLRGISSNGEVTLAPKRTATRAETMALLQRFLMKGMRYLPGQEDGDVTEEVPTETEAPEAEITQTEAPETEVPQADNL